MIPNPLTYLPTIAESDNQDALSDAVKGRAAEIKGSGFAPIETRGEPRTDENPLPITVNITDPVKAGLTDEIRTGSSASYDIVTAVENLNKAEVTSRTAACLEPDKDLQFAEESEIHLDDSHEDPENDTDCETETIPKRTPMTERDVEPVLAAFETRSKLTPGRAYDRDNVALLLWTPTEAIAAKLRPLPEENLQSTALLEIQATASDTELPRRIRMDTSDRPNLLPITVIEEQQVPGFSMVLYLADEIPGGSK